MSAEPARVCAWCRTRPIEPAWRPFCSERCRLLDLARWVNGEYRISGEPAPSAEPAETRPPGDGDVHS